MDRWTLGDRYRWDFDRNWANHDRAVAIHSPAPHRVRPNCDRTSAAIRLEFSRNLVTSIPLGFKDWLIVPIAIDTKRPFFRTVRHEATHKIIELYIYSEGRASRAHDEGRAPCARGGGRNRGRTPGHRGGRNLRDSDRKQKLPKRAIKRDVRSQKRGSLLVILLFFSYYLLLITTRIIYPFFLSDLSIKG